MTASIGLVDVHHKGAASRCSTCEVYVHCVCPSACGVHALQVSVENEEILSPLTFRDAYLRGWPPFICEDPVYMYYVFS